MRNVRGDLILHDNNGNVEVATIAGNATISNSFGNVTFSDVKGRVSVTTNNGKVEGRNIGGDSLTVRDSFGNILNSDDIARLSATAENCCPTESSLLRDARCTSAVNLANFFRRHRSQ